MNAEKLRTYIPNLKNQRVLNISYTEDKCYSVLAMMAEKDGKLCLWEISGMTEEEYEHRHRRYRRPKTNRASHKENLSGHHDTLRIKALELEGQHYHVDSAAGTGLGDECNIEERVLLLYMLQQGVKLGELEQVPFSRLMISTYELTEEWEIDDTKATERRQTNEPAQTDVPEQSAGLNITLELSARHIPIPIHKRFHLKIGKYTKPRVIHVTGEAEAAVYIHGITFYDIWEESKTRFEDERYKERFTAEQIEQMKKTYMESLPKMCPKGCVLPVIEYECDKDYQMQFYTTEYLKREPEHSSSSVLMMMRPEKKIGPMGCRNQACLLEAVEKGFEGDIAVELFACYKKIPEKLITGKLL
ncbi:MAG: hypothetical protein J6J86_02515 [Lachnospiraceae bacterium]|nr:hypothetical protein [Lachnospiraceae bacterium]